MSHEQAGAAVADANNTLRSPFSSEGAAIRQKDDTIWIFYYGFNDEILYQKRPKFGNATRHQLIIDGKPVVGSATELAATLAFDSPRLYYIDRTLIVREAYLSGTSGDKWLKGALSNQDWKVASRSSLTAIGTSDLDGASGSILRLYFNESEPPGRFTEASYTDRWTKSLF